jgi:hypothetical protein
MDHTLQKILRKVDSVQVGLLRAADRNEKHLLQARAAGNGEQFLNCVITKDGPGRPFQFRTVSLIQKDKQDYLYITCRVKELAENPKTVVMSMEVLKASWFTRRSRGSLSWLQQKYHYEKAS